MFLEALRLQFKLELYRAHNLGALHLVCCSIETCSASNVDNLPANLASCVHEQKENGSVADKDAICDACGPCQMIQSILKPLFVASD